MELGVDQILRYTRHLLMPEIGEVGQARLLDSRVLVVGAGGLGSPVIFYLAAAGVGTIAVVDDDVVDLSNLQRQILHSTPRLGRPKVDSAAETIAALNPDVTIVPIRARLTPETVGDILGDYPVVADCTDNFASRFLLNDACRLAGRTLVSAAVLGFSGQLSTFRPDGPCYRCIHGGPPPAGGPSCSTAGVLGAVPGMMGAMQATEIIKELLGIGQTMAGRLLIHDGLAVSLRVISVPRDPGCPLCGTHPRITRPGEG